MIPNRSDRASTEKAIPDAYPGKSSVVVCSAVRSSAVGPNRQNTPCRPKWRRCFGSGERTAANPSERRLQLVEAAVVPTLLLALAWAGVWSRETDAELALAAAVLQIIGWALVAGRRAGWTWPRTGVFAAGQGTLGIGLLLLERVVH